MHERLESGRRQGSPETNGRSGLLVFAPHPDDEILGVGGQLPHWAGRVGIAHVSDGAPVNPSFYRPLGFDSRDTYARARRQEALDALALAGIGEGTVHQLGAVDQGVCHELEALTRRVLQLITELAPRVVLAPPYEGGHPDHDGTSFAVHAALRLLTQRGVGTPRLLEYASYHLDRGRLVFGEFLSEPKAPALEVVLDPAARSLKRKMIECHRTQCAFLSQFGVEHELLRYAPAYDFREPPRAPCLYDQTDFGVRGSEFVRLASRALRALGIEGAC